MFTLRPSQEHDLDALRRELGRHRSVLLVAPCGYGKGVVTTKIIDGLRQRGKHALFLVHGRDRVNDMDERVSKLDIPHGVLMGGRHRTLTEPVQIASSDTVHRMEEKPPADLIIIDECHLAMSPTFRGVLDCYPKAKIIGLTATPILGTGHALGQKSGGIFESMVRGPCVRQLISDGYLVGSRVFQPPRPDDLKSLKKKRNGEYDEAEGEYICDRSTVVGDLVENWRQHSSDRKTAAFGFTQKHAWHIAEAFRAADINWAYVDANTPDDERKLIWNDLDHGDLRGVSSVGCISVGWDHAVCKSLILASLTSSFPLYHQRLGRGSRPYRGYSDFLVLDHCGNVQEHQERGPFFESDIDWMLDGDLLRKKSKPVSTCDEAVPVPDDGVIPESFIGPVEDGWMLPCFATYDTGPKACPYCGLPRQYGTREREIENEDSVLGELTLAEREALEEEMREEAQRKQVYFDLVRITREKNYKPGYPAMVYKAKYGYWPPRGWKYMASLVA